MTKLSSKNPHRILIVEDSPTMMAVCTEKLQEFGFQCDQAVSAEDAWQILTQSNENQSYSVILLDWILPEMSGKEFLLRLGKDSRFDAIPVMIFTEHPDEDVWEMVLSRFKNEIQLKTDLDVLPKRIQRFIESIDARKLSPPVMERLNEAELKVRAQETILLVDDSPTVRTKYAGLLHEAGYRVIEAGGYAEGYALAQSVEPSLAIIDFYMPDGNGDKLCKALLDSVDDIAVVMLSQRESVRHESLNAGAIDLLSKDAPSHQFMMRVNTIVNMISSGRSQRKIDLLTWATEACGFGIMGYTKKMLTAQNPAMEDFSNLVGSLEFFDTLATYEAPLIYQNSAGEAFYFVVQRSEYSIQKEEIIIVQDITPLIIAQKQLIENNTLLTNTNDALNKSNTQLVQMASFDPLTGLANRSSFYLSLSQALSRQKRTQKTLAVLYLDMDHFKYINDNLGHDIGDKLLHESAERLSSSIRAGDFASRIGGDEFGLILFDINGAEDASFVAQKIITALAKPFTIDKHQIHISFSIGIAILGEELSTLAELVKAADTAMYSAKADGGNNYRYYTEEMQEKSEHIQHVQLMLQRATENKEFSLVYQPKISLSQQRMVGCEALLRWQPPNGETIGPAQFIPIAEDSGSILEIGQWVLEAACQQIKVWREQDIYRDLVVSINVSARQLGRQEFFPLVKRALEENGIPGTAIEFEITETGVMEYLENVIVELQMIHKLGIEIAIDDFGTGYSSIELLRRLPINILKIDRSFVADIGNDLQDEELIRVMLTVAETLKLKVVAEGVETLQQLAFLSEEKCDLIQGYYFSRPMSPVKFSDLLSNSSEAFSTQFSLYDKEILTPSLEHTLATNKIFPHKGK